MALAMTGETSTISIAPEAKLVSNEGDVQVDAQAEVVNKVRAETAIFQDGTGGFSVAVGVDNATVTAEVAGEISSKDSVRTREILSLIHI